jgi:penicillin-binding protein 1A
VILASLIHMPQVDQLVDFTPNLITRFFDSEGEMFASYAQERRVLMREGEVPKLLQQAIVSAEDSNFFEHGGIDARGALMAVVRNYWQGRRAFGASTITMQLARELFLYPRKTWRRKIEQAFLAVELEKSYSKQQILTLYCNVMYLGHGNYGMEAAARYFFDHSVDDLSLVEAATLAGILQRPSSYSPTRRPELVVSRRDYVLRRMEQEGYISGKELEEALAEPLQVVRRRQEEDLAPYFAEDIRRDLESRYGKETLLQKGLQVHTTLDAEIQQIVERALRDGLQRIDRINGWRGPISHLDDPDLSQADLASWKNLNQEPGRWNEGVVIEVSSRQARIRIGANTYDLSSEDLSTGKKWGQNVRLTKFLSQGDVAWFSFSEPDIETGESRLQLEQEPEVEGAALVIESSTGAIRALTGGWDFNRSKFNRATQARRQVGSAFKPFVWGAALEMGFTPADTLFDAPVAYPGTDNIMNYSPRNNSRDYFGIVTLRQALESSMNATAVKLLDLVGPRNVIDFAERCGIRSELPPYPTLALGAADILPIELAAAYSTFANQGVWVEPYFIDRVTDPDGRPLEEHQTHTVKAMEPEIAYLLTHLLQGVVDRGTAVSIADLELELAGKSGTTDVYTDAWFVGYTPRHTVLVWVGYDINRSIGKFMTGSRAALPIWRQITEHGIENGWISNSDAFVAPPGIILQDVEYRTGLVPGAGATRLVKEAFIRGTQPVLQYEKHWADVMKLPWYQQRAFYVPKIGERMPEDVSDWTPVLEAWEGKDPENE